MYILIFYHLPFPLVITANANPQNKKPTINPAPIIFYLGGEVNALQFYQQPNEPTH